MSDTDCIKCGSTWNSIPNIEEIQRTIKGLPIVDYSCRNCGHKWSVIYVDKYDPTNVSIEIEAGEAVVPLNSEFLKKLRGDLEYIHSYNREEFNTLDDISHLI